MAYKAQKYFNKSNIIMNIRVLSDKKIMLKEVKIKVYMDGQRYDTVYMNIIFEKRSANNYSYFSTFKSNLRIIQKLSYKYEVKMKYLKKKVRYRNISTEDIFTQFKYYDTFDIEMPENYKSRWLIRKRDSVINNILED